jgi:hypothetical protein
MHALIDPSRFVIDSVTMSPRGSYHVRLQSTITVESLGLVRGESTRPLTGQEVRRLSAASSLVCWCADDETRALYGEPAQEPQVDEPPEAEDEPGGADGLLSLTDRAEALGVKVDGRWGEARLRAEIEKAEAGEEDLDW